MAVLAPLAGQVATVLISGDRGSGKSALVAAATRTWHGQEALVVTARASASVLNDVYDQLVTRGGPIGSGWRANPIPLVREIVRLLRSRASTRPVVVVVEDVHRADAASVAALAVLVPSARAAGVAVVMSALPGAAVALAALADREIAVPPLDDGQITDVVTAWLQGGNPPDNVLLTAIRSGLGPMVGNPGALESVRDVLLSEARLTRTDRHLCLREPERPLLLGRNHHLVRTALDEGGHATRTLALAVAKLGRVEISDLASVLDGCGLPRSCGNAVDDLVAAGVLIVDGSGVLPAVPALTHRLRREAESDWRPGKHHAVECSVMSNPEPIQDRCIQAYQRGDWETALSMARAMEIGDDSADARRSTRLIAAEICAERGEQRRSSTWSYLVGVQPAGCHLTAWVTCGNRRRSGRTAEAARLGWDWYSSGEGDGLGASLLLGRIAEYGLLAGDRRIASRADQRLADDEGLAANPFAATTSAMITSALDRDLVGLRQAIDRAQHDGHTVAVIRGCQLAALVDDDPTGWLSTGYGQARRIGALHTSRQFAESMRALGVAVPRSRESDARFTAVEIRVAELVSSGKTNRQIASLLFLSEKTVEGHLTKLFDKTSCRSRVELATAHLQGKLVTPS